ncbi:hypothetical protein DRW03_32640 [Corallococcus sp. H22C18031201]|uniref:hypothetical protein n=1 Tax=Citreicoccus inhibens TaxID=2849499 RepID=UPI000E71C180|nr:hypothetical protein [Citreicoccus inhibens]MBU8897970.1 hypothetical protein [Citreicoccus inhibens]RJS15827.1 hypothetical protein DRW03_32640 [Corallococcus sp. H22C18031201]
MRLLALVSLVGLVSACGAGSEEQPNKDVSAQGAPDSWCRSYTTQQFCPKNICAWYSTPAPGYCSLPATE